MRAAFLTQLGIYLSASSNVCNTHGSVPNLRFLNLYALVICGSLTGSKVFPAKFSNTCWSLVHKNDGIKVGATYKATDEKIAKVDGFISATNESADLRKATYEESEGWYAGITADMFG